MNCHHAQQRGWTTAHLVEDTGTGPDAKAAQYQIRDLEELRGVFPQFFKDFSAGSAIACPGLALHSGGYQDTENHITTGHNMPGIAGVS